MSWKDEAEELKKRERWAEELGGKKNVGRLHAKGRPTIREMIGDLVDAGSFQEVGKLTGTGDYDGGKVKGVTPAPYVMGLGRIDGRDVAIGGHDFTVRGGTTWSGDRLKGGQGGFVEDLAHEYRIPLINLIDGAGGTVNTAKRLGHTTFPGVHGFEQSVALLGEVPVISVVTGSAAGGPAARAALSHWSLMVRGTGHIFAAGPAVVERSLGQKLTKEELGGPEVAAEAGGTIDNVVESAAAGFAAIRRYLSYMPQNVWELPPRGATDDPADRAEEELLSIIPRDRRRPYDMRKLIGLIADRDSMFEIQPGYGGSVITCLARMNGYSVGFIANNPKVIGGALDARAARKQAHFAELCDAFHIPLIFLVDVPGFMVGLKAEEEGTLRDGVRAVFVGLQVTVPVLTVVVRKCYGMAGMATCAKNGLDIKLAWPSAEWGSLPVEGGVAVAYRREIENAPDPQAREQEIEAELRSMASPFRTAEAFGVEDMIDPRATRAYLCRFIAAAQTRIRTDVGQKLKPGVRP